MTVVAPASLEPAPGIDAVDFYTRPGCVFSSLLWRGLERRGVVLRRHDIWSDPEAAARVRAVARGSETVPTIGVGDEMLVNPRIPDVLSALERRAPHLVPLEPPSGRTWRRVWRVLTRA